MEQFSTTQRVLIAKTFYENEICGTQTVQKTRTIFRRNKALCNSTVLRPMAKFETTFLVLMVKSPERKRSCRTEKHLVFVPDSVTVNPGKSIRQRLQQLDISTTSWQQIFHKNLHLQSYKIQLTQNLKPVDRGMRRQFADWVLDRLALDNNFLKQIIFYMTKLTSTKVVLSTNKTA